MEAATKSPTLCGFSLSKISPGEGEPNADVLRICKSNILRESVEVKGTEKTEPRMTRITTDGVCGLDVYGIVMSLSGSCPVSSHETCQRLPESDYVTAPE